ncbi:hypothetical protein ABTZ99_09405 [Actinosynnema sp. NPDC002837]
MTAHAETPARGRRRKLARAATEVFAPWIWVLGLPLAVSWHATGDVLATLAWGAVVGITGSVVPMLVIIRGARRGLWDGRHVTRREDRFVPFITCICSLGVGIAALLIGDGPGRLIALAVGMFVSLIASVAITFALPVPNGRGWKISIHAAVAAGAVMVLTIDYGPWLLLLTPAVALVAWSRVELRDHTTPQVLGGTALGALVGGLLYWLLI